MGDAVCFSTGALTLLGVIWGVVVTGVTTVFWLFVRSQQDALRDCRTQRDDAQEQRNRATDNLDLALKVGETAVRNGPAQRRER